MDKSKVYFTNLRTKPGQSLLQKLENLIKAAGIDKIDFENKFTAIKMHLGEPGNLAFIRPNYVATIVKYINSKGGKVFVTDSNTLYTGRRANAIDHLTAAAENGFSPVTIGCNVIIADGIKGTDYREIEINLKHCKTAKIGSAIADADIIISMTHFKGHEMTGFGGTLKNLGMGSGSRGGKLEMHSASKPIIKEKNCVSCGMCVKSCSQGAISFNSNKKASIDYDKCVGCGQCVAVCQFNAAMVKWNESADSAIEKISEYAYAAIKGKPSFHISFIMNVSPDCDCFGNNDMPIIADIGIAASFDPIALDKASVDLVNKAPVIHGSCIDDSYYVVDDDKFNHIHPDTNWKQGLEHGESIGLGSQKYELIEVK
ncbi:MAG TPA: DUF362 domain-containing protein [Clostridiaceae bacterium]